MRKPPLLAQKPYSETFHGARRADPFAWVRADNWQAILKDPSALPAEIKNHLLAENEWLAELLAPVADLERELLAEMKARVPDEDSSPPEPYGDFFYGYEFRTKAEQPCFFRTDKNKQNKRSLLDADELSRTHDFFKLGDTAPSDDHLYFAYSADISGGEFYDIFVSAIADGAARDKIKNCDGSFEWVGTDIFYITLDEQHRPYQVKCHTLGAKAAADRVIFTNPDPAFFLSIEKALGGKYLFISVYDHDSSEVFALNTDVPTTPHLLKPRQPGVEYDVGWDAQNKRFFMRTNEQAVDFQILAAPEDDPQNSQTEGSQTEGSQTEGSQTEGWQPKDWKPKVAHQEGVYILDFILLKDYLLTLVRVEGLPKLIAHPLNENEKWEHSFSPSPHQLDWTEGFVYDTKTLRLFYSSPRQPQQTFDFDLTTRTTTLLKEQQVKGGHNPDDFICKRLHATAADGATIPISIFYHKDTPPNANRPLWLYGYGSYGLTITPSFSHTRLSLVQRGVGFAIAHVRGGAMMGRSWYLKGKLEHKTNTFSDFITCAETLIAQGFVAKGNLIAQGGSAGGMLMGAVANLAPDLFKAIIAQVPFVDVLATMLDDTLPLTPPEWLEWGNPIASKAAFERIAAYSPYDNVRRQVFPWILATSGVSDPRVGYWEATKWVAALRQAQLGTNPIALKTEMKAGHGGKTGRFASLDELASVYAFAMLAIRS